MKNHRTKALLIGCGNLGTILAKSWIKHNTFNQIVIVQPSLSAQDSFENLPQLSFVSDDRDIPEDFIPDVIVIAAKPRQLPELLPHYSRYQNSALFISLATGISINHLHEKLGSSAHIIRLMPNIGIQVDQSLNLAYAPPSLSHEYKDLTHKIFGHSGPLIWLDHEELLDKLTPISGSGPAYFFLLTEVFAETIAKSGISKKIALKIAKQVLLGSALLTKENHDLEELKASVASKGGVTEAALEVLESQLPDLIDNAMNAAMDRLHGLQLNVL